MDEWERLVELWNLEAGLGGDETWVPLAEAEARAGVSRSALRAWYRSGQLPSRMVDGPHGPQRLVPLEAVLERADQSPRIQRKTARAVSLEAEFALLHERVGELERRLAALEGRTGTDGTGDTTGSGRAGGSGGASRSGDTTGSGGPATQPPTSGR